jgi:hypothetical protein
VKAIFGTACVVFSWILMGTSVLLLCSCPWYPASGAAFAGVAFWLKGPGSRLGPVLALCVCLMMTAAHWYRGVQVAEAKERIRNRLLANSPQISAVTNQTAENTNAK